MADICGDNRFELIEKYKQKLLDATNIGGSHEEMAVIDNILFRFWQMGWLEKLELFGNSEQLESDHVADPGKMVGDSISGRVALDALADYIHTVDRVYSTGMLTHDDCMDAAHSVLDELPSAQPDVPDTNVGDTISRTAAIETVRKAKSIGQAHRMLVQIPSAQQWIPVSDRLPKKVDDYLVTTHGGQIARYIFMGDGASKDYWMRCVVAWMPLPAPYRQEGDGDNVHKPD